MSSLGSSVLRWSRVLVWVEGALIALAVAVAGVGIAMVVTDERDRTDVWDGIGTSIGLATAVVAGAVASVTAVLLGVTQAARAGADVRRVRRSAWCGLLLGLVWFAGVLLLGAPSSDTALWVPLTVPAAVLAASSSAVIVECASTVP